MLISINGNIVKTSKRNKIYKLYNMMRFVDQNKRPINNFSQFHTKKRKRRQDFLLKKNELMEVLDVY